MKTTPRFALAWHVRAALLLLACLALSGCTPMLVDVLKQDPRDPDRYVRVRPAELAGVAMVYRNGRAQPVNLPYQLRPGDVIQTGPDAVARIRFPEGHEVILDVNTRARLGSFFVEFGRILARARGFFEAESENVVAGVEGTEFVFQVPRDRSVMVTVLDGVVVCRSRTGVYPPVRLRRGETFLAQPNAALPDTRLATPDELEDIRRWIRQVDGVAPPPPARPDGFCCDGGRVFETSRGRCRGMFFAERGAAEASCQPPRPEFGYCCSDGEVFRTARERCRGSFHLEQRDAERACQRAPQGFCCADGRVFESGREQCRGRFFPDRGSAAKYCRPPPESGYCCNDGEVSKSTREQCRGSFHRDAAVARTACRRAIEPPRRFPPGGARPYEIVPRREPAAPDIK
ncbi:MAG: FecR domain-containing protein [Sterolibacteriaceae bacterium]|nr:FecR domain-containing protein [Sterolibacteriaceae bacterium]